MCTCPWTDTNLYNLSVVLYPKPWYLERYALNGDCSSNWTSHRWPWSRARSQLNIHFIRENPNLYADNIHSHFQRTVAIYSIEAAHNYHVKM